MSPSTTSSAVSPGRRLRGADSGFLHVESPSQNSTCVGVLLLAPPADGAPALTRDDLVRLIAARADRVPHFDRRLQHVPGGLGHPVWSDDPHFVLDNHVHHDVLPAVPATTPGTNPVQHGDQMLDAWIADHASAHHVDLSRPLWDITLLDGFPDRRQALVHRHHHALGDGAAALAVLSELFDDRALDVPSPAPPADHSRHRPRPGVWLAVVALLRLLVVLLTLPALVMRTVRRIKDVRARRAVAERRVPGMAGDAPRTVLNNSADARRVLARAHLHLDDVRKVKEAAGVSLSDVVVSLVAGALRSHLNERDALPEVPLVVNVPLGNDPVGARPRLRGNVFVNYYALLPTHLDDARSRLRDTAEHAREAKLQLELQGRSTITDWLDRIPPRLAAAAASMLAEKARSGESPPDFNVLVSNLKVPRPQWRTAGRDVISLFMLGPITDGHGLNITVTGYGETLTCGVHANPSAVPDPSGIAQAMVSELQTLLAVHGLACTTCPRVA